MHDDFPQNARPFLVTLSLLLAAFALVTVMLIYTSVKAEAQTLCAPAKALIEQFAKSHGETPVWGGVVPSDKGPVEVIILQSEKSTWTLISIRQGIACILTGGTDANPPIGKGV